MQDVFLELHLYRNIQWNRVHLSSKEGGGGGGVIWTHSLKPTDTSSPTGSKGTLFKK